MIQTIQTIPVWTDLNAVPAQYPWLAQDITCDVAIVGGGITGAMCAKKFAQEGIQVALLAAGAVGCGNSSCSNGILHYEAGRSMTDLSRHLDMDSVIKVYEICDASINNIEQMAGEFNTDIAFGRKDSLLFSASEDNYRLLKQEYLIRRHNGFNVDYYDASNSPNAFSFEINSGIYSKNLSAQLDPYRFAHALMADAAAHSAQIFENSSVVNIVPQNDQVVLHTSTRYSVTANKVIIAAGSDTVQFSLGVPSQRTTIFSIATDPIENFAGWLNTCIVHDIDSCGVTIRTTPDNRIIISGLESMMVNASGRLGGVVPVPQLMEKKYRELETMAREMFPAIRNIKAAYKYSGTHVEASDGLPIIGEHPAYPHFYFAMCSGINGIVYGEIAARMLLTVHSGKVSDQVLYFRPGR